MKTNLHPTVRQVVFKDVSGDFSFLGTSTMDSKETIKWEDGKSYEVWGRSRNIRVDSIARFARRFVRPCFFK